MFITETVGYQIFKEIFKPMCKEVTGGKNKTA
jgi:hypothetical protein